MEKKVSIFTVKKINECKKKNYLSTQITIKRGIKMTAQKKLLRNIGNKTNEISMYLNEMEGQMDFFANLIADIEGTPVTNITLAKRELIEKKLHAVLQSYTTQNREYKRNESYYQRHKRTRCKGRGGMQVINRKRSVELSRSAHYKITRHQSFMGKLA